MRFPSLLARALCHSDRTPELQKNRGMVTTKGEAGLNQGRERRQPSSSPLSPLGCCPEHPSALFLQGTEMRKVAHGGAEVAVPAPRSAPRGRPLSGVEPGKTSSITAAELQCQLMFRYRGFISYSMGFLVSSFKLRDLKGRKSQQQKKNQSKANNQTPNYR